MDYFRDKHVIVTGGSSGIGLATARLLRSSGAHLLLIARDADKLAAARELLLKIPGSAELKTLSLDVGDGEAVSAAAQRLREGRPIDMLINNAGVVVPATFLELKQADFDDMMRINFMGGVHMTRAVLPSLLERGSGHIGFVSSLIGLMGIFGYTAYAASKFAQRGFAEALRCELKPRNIRVSICFPPDTDTPQHAWELKVQPPEARAISGNAKVLSAEEVASKLLAGMAAGRFYIIPGGSTRFADLMYRLFPGMVRSIFDGDVRKVQKAQT